MWVNMVFWELNRFYGTISAENLHNMISVDSTCQTANVNFGWSWSRGTPPFFPPIRSRARPESDLNLMYYSIIE